MSSESKFLKELKKVISGNLALEVINRYQKQYRALKPIKDKIPTGDQEINAIVYTSAGKRASEFFVWSLNKLDKELNKEFPYPKLILKRLRQVRQNYRASIKEHFGSWEGAIRAVVLHLLGSQTLIGDKTIVSQSVVEFLEDKKKDQD